MILVGTSGWQYRDWKGQFYPSELAQKEWLPYFSERFPTVEVNNTFYNLPKAETFVAWRERSAAGFLIAVKANRYITHIRRLRECRDAVDVFWERAKRLGGKLGPVLFQLPPNLRRDDGLLREFLGLLPASMRAAFEFRHDSWAADEVHRMLDERGCALVLADRPGWRVPRIVTGGWSYIRFHEGNPHGPDYPRDKLRRWAARIASMPAEEIYVYFNNDPTGAAIRDAMTLTGLLHAEGVAVRGPSYATV